MSTPRRRIATLAVSSIAALSLGLAGCSVGEIGGDSGATEGQTEITYLFGDSGGTAVPFAEAMIKKFNEMNPDIKVGYETQPAGTEGDNLIKTKLATGEMADVFGYNSGSLFQAINPDQNLVPLTDESWAAALPEEFKTVVSTDNGLYGAPTGTTQAGGVIYNKKVYADLGLKVPTTWAEFKANNDKIKADGKVDPIEQTYGETWTAQLFVLADFANVAAQDPEWADQYTANKRKYVDEPALQSFKNQQDAFESGYFNKNFASASYDDGVKAVATGTAAHYPMLSSAIAAVNQNFKDNVDDVGFFALPVGEGGRHADDHLAAQCGLHPQVDRGGEAGGGQEVRGLLQLPRGLCDPERDQHRDRTVRLDLRAAVGCAPAGHRRAEVPDRRQVLPGPGVRLAREGAEPLPDHCRGRIRHQDGGGGCAALRRGRQEAGPAAGSRRLVTHLR